MLNGPGFVSNVIPKSRTLKEGTTLESPSKIGYDTNIATAVSTEKFTVR